MADEALEHGLVSLDAEVAEGWRLPGLVGAAARTDRPFLLARDDTDEDLDLLAVEGAGAEVAVPRPGGEPVSPATSRGASRGSGGRRADEPSDDGPAPARGGTPASCTIPHCRVRTDNHAPTTATGLGFRDRAPH